MNAIIMRLLHRRSRSGPVILESDRHLSNQELERIREKWTASFMGSAHPRLIVLPKGLRVVRIYPFTALVLAFLAGLALGALLSEMLW